MASFDSAAVAYDDQFTFSRIGQFQRDQVWTYLKNLSDFNRPLKILELNCGTGYDAAFMAKHGHQVIATDISDAMLSKTRQRLASDDLEKQVELYKYDLSSKIQEQEKLIGDHWAPNTYDMIFSNFGGLNCISPDELTRLCKELENLLLDKGHVIFVLMPRYCLVDLVYNFIKLRFKKVFNRIFAFSVLVDVDDEEVATYYHCLLYTSPSPRDLSTSRMPSSA